MLIINEKEVIVVYIQHYFKLPELLSLSYVLIILFCVQS